MIFYTWQLDLRIFLRWLSPIEEDHFLAPTPATFEVFWYGQEAMITDFPVLSEIHAALPDRQDVPRHHGPREWQIS